MKTITVTIDVDGTTTVEVGGVSGPSCEAMTRELEAALGGLKARSRKPEYRVAEAKATVRAGA